MSTADATALDTAGAPRPQPDPDTRPPGAASTVAGLLLVVLLAALTRFLELNVPGWTEGTPLARIAKPVEFPVYAIALGLLGNAVLVAANLKDKLAAAFRTELFIKTGVVLLGASVNLSLIVTAAAPAIVQALVLISSVFLFTWWVGGRFGLDDKLRALLSSAVSICGVSAAISAAGAVQAKREQLAYAASLVIVFALPSIFVLPWLVDLLGLSPAVAGAWIGGNIDTTAAVAAAGTLAGEDALALATIVKATQNALIGVVAIALTAYFAFKVERRPDARGPGAGELWRRFPKFVLGFLAASVIGTVYLAQVGSDVGKPVLAVANDLRTLFFILAFVSIGLELRVKALRAAGWRPVAVFGLATVFNLVVGLASASVLFAGFEL
ncbi:YeiH family protein [Cellulomonas chengniuliangii]|uniref:Sulfate exporter family transporter n=1 Tax=Cellulomonas chengniuliangii TaxID=2968084 RepID=A0ABY5KX62_9CELL|nr:putative sulfate exporter family transporter [Cellulomonas chengniuliangii]MCC2309435.1 putative sulfate exporter family transporter [Cellulomonas chengniuliangii]UUI75004.1 putative sulfate exporter family transporter [Cellulomonas chengniuliangii]